MERRPAPPRQDRGRPRRSVLVLAMCVPLLAPACSGGKKGATPTPPASSASPAAPSPSATPAAPAPAPASPSPPAAPPSPSPSRVPSATASPQPVPPPARPARLSPAAAGRYVYDEKGTRGISGCIGGNEPVPPTSTALVDPPAGGRQRAVWDRRTPGGQGVLLDTTLELRGDGVYLARLRQVQTTALGPFEASFEPVPPPLVAPVPAEAGRSWHVELKSVDGSITVSVDARVEAANEAAGLGDGSTVPAVRIARTTHVTGLSLQGFLDVHEQATTWVSLEHGVPVREDATTGGTVGLCTLDFHTGAVLRSATPAP